MRNEREYISIKQV